MAVGHTPRMTLPLPPNGDSANITDDSVASRDWCAYGVAIELSDAIRCGDPGLGSIQHPVAIDGKGPPTE